MTWQSHAEETIPRSSATEQVRVSAIAYVPHRSWQKRSYNNSAHRTGDEQNPD
ncbi:MAG: hypothetical protein IIB40_11715 [Candidatus Marinimicrobia bacterium]|nr:hypothetical protein [Candidatus Neomarinimicrobiota bacterium]